MPVEFSFVSGSQKLRFASSMLQIVVVNDGDGSHAAKSKTNHLRHDFSAAVICFFVAGRVKNLNICHTHSHIIRSM